MSIGQVKMNTIVTWTELVFRLRCTDIYITNMSYNPNKSE